MNGDPNSIYVSFIDEFKTFKYWVWDSFEFSTMTVDQAVELEAPNHVLYDPQESYDLLPPMIVFSLEEETQLSYQYLVTIYDEERNSDFVQHFRRKFKMEEIVIDQYSGLYRHRYKLEAYYERILNHSIDFKNVSLKDEEWKNSLEDFHLIPVIRPYTANPEWNIMSAGVPLTDRRLDLTSHLSEDKTIKSISGQWEFYIDHEKWSDWATCYRALVNYFHGMKMRVFLKDYDDGLKEWMGRIIVQNYSPGSDYSKISFQYWLSADRSI